MDEGKLKNICDSFDDAFQKMISEMLKLQLFQSTKIQKITGKKIAAIVGVVGLNRGSVHIEMNEELARRLYESSYGEPPENEMDLCFCLAEFTNMVSGKGITALNNIYKSINLRLTPPAIFIGDNLDITTSQVLSASKLYNTNFGAVRVEIGFEGV